MFRGHGLLFVHVPKTAGMAVGRALYGETVQHASIRYYQMAAPALVASVPTFAIVRDPVERFLSAYAYACAGGTADNAVSEPFRSIYRGFRSVDDALDHLEAANWPYGVDHIFRPQSWYVMNEDGVLGVDHLIPLRDMDRALKILAPWAAALPLVNCSHLEKPELTPRQEWRVRYLYAADLRLPRLAKESMMALWRRDV